MTSTRKDIRRNNRPDIRGAGAALDYGAAQKWWTGAAHADRETLLHALALPTTYKARKWSELDTNTMQAIAQAKPRRGGASRLSFTGAGAAAKLQAPALFGGFAAMAGIKQFTDGKKGWFVVDAHGQRMHGPFGSPQKAQAELEKRQDLPFAAGGIVQNSRGGWTLPAFDDWSTSAGGTAAHESQSGYSVRGDFGQYFINAHAGPGGRKTGSYYTVAYASMGATEQPGLWRTLPGHFTTALKAYRAAVEDFRKLEPSQYYLDRLPQGGAGLGKYPEAVSGYSAGYSQVHPASLPTGAMGAATDNIPLDQIEADPTQPRKDFNPELLKELSDSMKAVGQIHAVLVRPHPDKPGRFMLVAGERRYRAAQKAGFKTLLAEVRDLTPIQAAEIQLAENEARAQPKQSETAKFVSERIRKGDPLEKIAQALGKSVSWVKVRQSMAGLSAFLLDLVDSGKLGTGTAAALGELPQEVQRSVWEAAALHSKTASGQEAYVRAVALREAGQDLFGQKIIEHVSGLTPKQRHKLITGVERALRCANKLASNKGGDVTAYAATRTNAAETLGQVKELARALARAARNVEKVGASRAVARKTRRADVMTKTQQHARKQGFWSRIFG